MTEPAVFYQPIKEERPWGIEVVACLIPEVATMKRLVMKDGCKGRLQRHHFKNEAGIVVKGKLLVRWVSSEGLREGELYAGDCYWFPPGVIHQEEAVGDTEIWELSTPHRNDREGMEEAFGLEVPPDALPSTKPEEVTEWVPWW